VAIVWERADNTIAVAAGDGAPPALADVSVPETVERGAPLQVSASASDIWTQSPTIAWEFGDGATKSGSSVTHSYAAAGTFTLRVTATDEAGHETTATRLVTVSGPPAPPQTTSPPAKPAPPATRAPVIEAAAGRYVRRPPSVAGLR
jgi:PKD repeat protein